MENQVFVGDVRDFVPARLACLMKADGDSIGLPQNMLMEILSQLPVMSIKACKLVQKEWFSIIESNVFAATHFDKAAPGLAVSGEDDDDTTTYRIFELDDSIGLENHMNHYGNEVYNFNSLEMGEIIGSVNCFLLVFEIEGFMVSNPVTREPVQVPYPPDCLADVGHIVNYGFGQSNLDNHYKIVFIRQQFENEIINSRCQVITIGLGEWRDIPFGSDVLYTFLDRLTFLNGNLHWLVYMDDLPLILVFDLGNEQFRRFSVPQLGHVEIVDDTNWVLEFPSVSILEDRLCLCASKPKTVDIWMMMEYGDEGSWSRRFMLRRDGILKDTLPYIYLVILFRDGDILLMLEKEKLISYSTISHTIEEISFFEDQHKMNAVCHKSSFLRLIQ